MTESSAQLLSCFCIQFVLIIRPCAEITSPVLQLLQFSSRKMKKNGRRKWKRPWDKKLLLLMPKHPKLTRASAKMLCRHPLQQTMCYWTISQKVSNQQQCHDSDSTCSFIYAGSPACFQLPFARPDWTFHQPFEHLS